MRFQRNVAQLNVQQERRQQDDILAAIQEALEVAHAQDKAVGPREVGDVCFVATHEFRQLAGLVATREANLQSKLAAVLPHGTIEALPPGFQYISRGGLMSCSDDMFRVEFAGGTLGKNRSRRGAGGLPLLVPCECGEHKIVQPQLDLSHVKKRSQKELRHRARVILYGMFHERLAAYVQEIDSSPTAPLDADAQRALTHEISVFADILQEPLRAAAQRRDFREILETVARSTISPRAEVEVFGSVAANLHRPLSDVDLCLIVPEDDMPELGSTQVPKAELSHGLMRQLEHRSREQGRPLMELVAEVQATEYQMRKSRTVFLMMKVTRQLRNIGRDRNWGNFNTVRHARVPVMQRSYIPPNSPLGTINFDMTLNRPIGVRNSLLLAEYVRLNPHVRSLMLVLKSYTQGLCNPLGFALKARSGSFFTSYALALLIVNYLQVKGQLPCIQEDAEPHTVDALQEGYTYNTGFRTDCSPPADPLPVGELLHGFFVHYGYEFNWESDVACVRLGRVVTKAELAEWLADERDAGTAPPYTESNRRVESWRTQPAAVEDPFEIDFNVCPFDEAELAAVRTQFRIAASLLRHTLSIGSLFVKKLVHVFDKTPSFGIDGTEVRDLFDQNGDHSTSDDDQDEQDEEE